MYLYKKDGTPFGTENAAKSVATRLCLENYDVVKIEGGFAINNLEKCEDPENVKNVENAESVEIPKQENEPIPEKVTDNTDIWVDGNWTEPADAFSIIDKYKDDRFVYKWANPKLNGGTRIEDLIQQNWRIDDVMKKYVEGLSSYKDNGTSTGTHTMVRGHLLMRMPKKSAKQRNEFYRNMANRGLKAEQEKLGQKVDGVYGNIAVNR